MAVLEVRRSTRRSRAADGGPIGRLGRWAADHLRLVALAWGVVAVVLAVFAPSVETALSGAGWQANGSESVSARTLIEQNFARPLQLGADGRPPLPEPHRRVAGLPAAVRPGGGRSSAPTAGSRRSHRRSAARPSRADGHTAIVIAGARGNPTTMVAAADDLKPKLAAIATDGVSVSLTGASGMWRDFNEANRSAMLKSELYSWPVTLVILTLAFGSLVAAGLPLMLTILGLLASAGLLALLTQRVRDLDLGDELRADVRARARNRLRALRRPPLPWRLLRLELPARDAVAVTMDTAGKAVLFSGATVLISLSAVMLVPEPGLPLDGARDHAQRRLRARSDADPAACGAGEARAAGGRAAAALGALGRAPLRALRPLGRAALAPPTPLRAGGDARCSFCSRCPCSG